MLVFILKSKSVHESSMSADESPLKLRDASLCQHSVFRSWKIALFFSCPSGEYLPPGHKGYS